MLTVVYFLIMSLTVRGKSSQNPRHEQNKVLRHARLHVVNNDAQKRRFS